MPIILQKEKFTVFMCADNFPLIKLCFRTRQINSEADSRTIQRIKENNAILIKNCPKFRNIVTANLMEALCAEVFPDGSCSFEYIRNVTMNSDKPCFAIRKIRTDGDFLSPYLQDDQTLLFSAHKFRGICYVDSINIVQNTNQLDYENRKAIYFSPKPLPEDNTIIDVIANMQSIMAATSKNLTEWEGYLSWKKEIANKQIHGAKYYNFSYSKETNLITFNLIFPDKETFDKEKRYLKRDICAFNNLISLGTWDFKYDRNLFRVDNADLGYFQGFVNEKNLSGNAEENDISIHEHPRSKDAEKPIKESSNQKYKQDDLKNLFKSAYVVDVRYKLPDEIQKDLEESNTDEAGAENDEIIEKYLKEIPKNGFIAVSAAGEFALIRRFENAIKDVKEGNCYSQTLTNWLFDVTKANLPSSEPEEITEWSNPLISKNQNQKEAVQKALNAPELFLLQGPPGTGKTTVIAEIIYQLVKKGNRILVSSQSNDAVDNALDRLASHPQVRAIRLGSRGGKKKKNDLQCKYVESEVLKHYYKSLADNISEKMLNQWNSTDSKLTEAQKDSRDIVYLIKQIDNLRITVQGKHEELAKLNEEFSNVSRSIENSQKNSNERENLRRQFCKFSEFCKDLKPYDVLPDSFKKILEKNIQSVYNKSETHGIHIPENFIEAHDFVCKQFDDVANQIKSSDGSASNSEVSNLNAKIKLCKDELAAAVDDEELFFKKRDELKKLNAKLDILKQKGGTSLSLSKNLFSENFIESCKEQKDKAIEILQIIKKEWICGVQKTCEQINEMLNDAPTSEELKKLTEQKKSLVAKMQVKKSEYNEKNNELADKLNQVSQMKKNYEVREETNELELQNVIQKRLESFTQIAESQKSFRKVFGSTMKTFTEKLKDENTSAYDKDLFLEDYIKTCNVVGISCTNNMRDLSSKGFENFDVVIIDEVSKATPPELLIPLMKAGKVILVGDHRQLPPMFKEQEKSYEEMINDLSEDEQDLKEILSEENFKKYKKMITASLFKSYFENADCSIKHSLLTQYRMHSDIMNVINRFYEHKLENGLSKEDERKLKAHNLTIQGIDASSFVSPDKHVFWLDSSFLPSGNPINETYRENSTSATNVLEKYLILELIKKIAAEYKKMGYAKDNQISVGIISFYQRQVNEIRDAVKKMKQDKEFKSDFESIDVDVNTVDRFQGKEKNIIITSLVRNNKYARASKHVVTYERINVAFSRAQNLLFIVGAEHMYRGLEITIPKMDKEGEITLPVYKNVIEELKRKGCYAKSRKLIPQDLEKKILEEYKAQGGK